MWTLEPRIIGGYLRGCLQYHANTNHRKVAMAILMSDKVDFKTKYATGDKRKCSMIIKWSFCQEDVIILKMNAYNTRVSKCTKQMLTKL